MQRLIMAFIVTGVVVILAITASAGLVMAEPARPAVQWITETVDTGSIVGLIGSPSIRIDASGYPHIAYGLSDLRYAWKDAAGWHIEVVDPVLTSPGLSAYPEEVSSFASLALDSAGTPHISYHSTKDGALRFASRTDSGWQIQTVDTVGDAGLYTSLVVHVNGDLHISYHSGSPNYDLKYAKRMGATWTTQTIDSAGDVGWWTSLALDASGYPSISYYDETNHDLKFARWNGQTWQIEVADSVGNNGWCSSLALNPDGTPQMSYFGNYPTWSLKLATRTPGGWALSVVDSSGQPGEFTGLDLDPLGYPHISYRERMGGDLKYARWTGSTWSIESVDTVGDTGLYTSLQVDAAGSPHIAYFDQANSRLRYARPASGSTPTPTSTPSIDIRVNAGGSAYTDIAGRLWSADRAYTPGSWGYVGSDPGSYYDGSGHDIIGTADDTLYLSQRYWGGTPGAIVGGYAFAVPNGWYQVTLRFAETFSYEPGQRVFDVVVEGQTVLSGLDLYSQYGRWVATDFDITSRVDDGLLSVDFRDGVSRHTPMVNAVRVMSLASVPGPTATPTRTPVVTASRTPTASQTRTRTPTATWTSTRSVTATGQRTPTASETRTVTRTPTPTLVACADAYEPDDTPAQAKSINVDGGAHIHSHAVPDDLDWMKFAASSEYTYTIRTSELQGLGNDTVIGLYAQDGSAALASNDDDPVTGGPGSRIEWRPTASGTYFVRVAQYQPATVWGCGIMYVVSVTRESAFPTATPTATLIPPPTETPTETPTHTVTASPTETSVPTPTGTATLTLTATPVVYNVRLPVILAGWPPRPGTPVLHPIDNSDDDNLYTVSWQHAVLASEYVLQEATEASFAHPTVVYQGDYLTWAVPQPGKMAGTYYYRVRGSNAWTSGDWSAPQSVTVNPSEPPVLQLIDNTDMDNRYVVKWMPSRYAQSYVLEEATKPEFTDKHTVYSGSALSWSVPSPGKTSSDYYYRVKAVTPVGETTWSNVQAVRIYGMFVGLSLRYDGNGYIRGTDNYNVGTHWTLTFPNMASSEVIHCQYYHWYDPNPRGWAPTSADHYINVETGYGVGGGSPDDSEWKWHRYFNLGYDDVLADGEVMVLDGQKFSVRGPLAGYTAFGKPVRYWELVNTESFLYWDGGGDWTQYVHTGDIVLRYDAGATRFQLYSSVLRRHYYRGVITSETVRYVDNLASSNGLAPVLGDRSVTGYMSEKLAPSDPAAAAGAVPVR